jgi:hypothetical protein
MQNSETISINLIFGGIMQNSETISINLIFGGIMQNSETISINLSLEEYQTLIYGLNMYQQHVREENACCIDSSTPSPIKLPYYRGKDGALRRYPSREGLSRDDNFMADLRRKLRMAQMKFPLEEHCN